MDALNPPQGRGRLYRVGGAVGRACGKSTSLCPPANVSRITHNAWIGSHGHPVGWTPVSPWVDNLVLYEWATIVSNLLLRTGLQYGLSTMYLEYQNLADPSDSVTIPSVTRGEGSAYYSALANSSDTDYLRVPLIAGTLASTDQTNFPLGNALTIFAQSAGLVGVNGKPFSAAAGSKVYGFAAVAAVDAADSTKDLVFSRVYFNAANQQAKLDSSQIGVSYQLPLN